MYKILEDNRVFIDYGPIQMSIDCRVDDILNIEIEKRVAEEVLKEFNKLLPYTTKLKQMRAIKKSESNSIVLNKMIDAVDITESKDLNTLASVAGSFSEYASEVAKNIGATKAIINNGGDIALYNDEQKPITVAIPVNDNQQLKIIVDKSMQINGICTSGLKGRSFTKGIATFCTVFASKSSVADACATYIANETNEEHPNILRCLAQDIDEQTDIKGQLITLKILDIPQEIKYKALLNGYKKALDLYEKSIIKYSVICIDNNIVKIPDNFKVEIYNKI